MYRNLPEACDTGGEECRNRSIYTEVESVVKVNLCIGKWYTGGESVTGELYKRGLVP